MLFPASPSSKGAMALTSAAEWNIVGNTFPDPSSTARPLAGLIKNNQRQPNFGTWVCTGDKIRIMSFE